VNYRALFNQSNDRILPHFGRRIKPGGGEEDPNEVILLFKAEDLNRAKAFAASDDLRERMQKIGVLDKPDIHFLNG
jgi:hypothetical protein